MKKSLMIVLFIVLIASLSFAGSITVNSPNGGESWVRGSSHNITWNGSGLTNPVKITLWKSDVLVGLIIKDQPANGTYNWSAGTYQGGTAIYGTDYKIKIREQGGASFTTEDVSNAVFTIRSAVSPIYEFEVYQPKFRSVHDFPGYLGIKWRKKLGRTLIAKKIQAVSTSNRTLIQIKRYVKIEIVSTKCPMVISAAQLKSIYQTKFKKNELSLKSIEALVKLPWLSLYPKWQIITAKTLDDGSFSWKIPAKYKKGCYKVRVTKLPSLLLKTTPQKLVRATSRVFYLVPARLVEVIAEIK